MPGRRKHWDEYDRCVEWQAKVSDAALPFESRWTEAALRRIDPGMHERFLAQRELFNASWKMAPSTRSESMARHWFEPMSPWLPRWKRPAARMTPTNWPWPGRPDHRHRPEAMLPGCRNCMATPYSGSRRMRSRRSSKWTRGSRRLSTSNGPSLERNEGANRVLHWAPPFERCWVLAYCGAMSGKEGKEGKVYSLVGGEKIR